MGSMCSAEPTLERNLVEKVDEHEGGINCMALNEDCSILVTGAEDCTARLWTTTTDKAACLGVLDGHDDYVNCVAMHDTFAYTGSADKTIRKWNITTCECVVVFNGHASIVSRLLCTGRNMR